MKSCEKLVKFLKHAINDDPICACGCRKHQHSDDGPCYGCGKCDYFRESEEEIYRGAKIRIMKENRQ